MVRAKDLLRPPPPPLPFLPRLPSLPFPVPESVVDALSPKLTVEEVCDKRVALEVYMLDHTRKSNFMGRGVCLCLGCVC